MPLEPLNYARPPVESATARHNRIYTALLIALALLCALGMISMFFMSRSPTIPPESRWTFQMIVWIYGVLIAAIVVILVLRGVAPRAGRIATMALNIVLLIVFPIGTALGIYGLLRVDKGDPPAGA
jgi:cell division protein FtsW (lipid II flippase)